MTQENQAENVTADEIASIKGPLAALMQSASEIERQLGAQDRYDAREDKRIALFEREVELHAIEAAHVQAHRERIEQIEQERNKHFASMAESLQALAKAALESR